MPHLISSFVKEMKGGETLIEICVFQCMTMRITGRVGGGGEEEKGEGKKTSLANLNTVLLV